MWVQVERSLTDPWAPGTVKEVLAGRGGDENFRVQLDEREVTVDEVEVWWKNSTRYVKRANLLEKEQQIVEAYYRVKQELRIGKM